MKHSSSRFDTQISESTGVWLTPALSGKEDDALEPLPTDDDVLFSMESKDRVLVAQASKLPGDNDAVQLYVLKFCLPVVDITCNSEAEAKKIAKDYIKVYEDNKKTLAGKAIDKKSVKESVAIPQKTKIIFETFDFKTMTNTNAPVCNSVASPEQITSDYMALIETQILAEKPDSPLAAILKSIKALMIEANDIKTGMNIDNSLQAVASSVEEEMASASDFAY